MLQKTIRLLLLALLCGVGQTRVSIGADEPVKTGEKRDTLLYVRTDPPGAKVLLNGKELGTSNGLFRVEPGTGTILVELEGRRPDERQVIIRANGVTRVELELRPQTKAVADTVDTYGARFVARLPQGTVELVGVTKYPLTRQSRWWRPDGSAAALGPFRTLQKTRSLAGAYSDEEASEFMFLVRVDDLPAEASPDPVGGVDSSTTPRSGVGTRNWLPGSGQQESNPCCDPIAGFREWEATSVYDAVDAHGAPTEDNDRSSRLAAAGQPDAYRITAPRRYKLFSGLLGGYAQTTDLRIGVSMGAWETVISRKPDSDGTSTFSRNGQEWTVTFHKATQSYEPNAEASTQVILSSLYTYGLWTKRLVAVTSDGSEHATSIGHNLGGDNGKAVFRGLPLSSIKEFRLQVRPYHWVEFQNVSLRSGRKTDVKVVRRHSQTPPATSAKPATDDRSGAYSIGHLPQGTVERVSITEGVKFYNDGDSITITEVKATSPDLRTGDMVIVKGYYTLASEPKASLCFFTTATTGSGIGPIPPEQQIGIAKGLGEFELSKTLDCDGYLHVTFYSISTGKPFGGLYFGTAKQMEEIKHWDVRSRYTSK
jgi:hypothetical protein